MKTTVKSPAEVIYSPPDTQMAYTRAQQAGQRHSTSPLSGQKIAAMAFAGAALLVAALSALQLPGLIATLVVLVGLALAADYPTICV